MRDDAIVEICSKCRSKNCKDPRNHQHSHFKVDWAFHLPKKSNTRAWKKIQQSPPKCRIDYFEEHIILESLGYYHDPYKSIYQYNYRKNRNLL